MHIPRIVSSESVYQKYGIAEEHQNENNPLVKQLIDRERAYVAGTCVWRIKYACYKYQVDLDELSRGKAYEDLMERAKLNLKKLPSKSIMKKYIMPNKPKKCVTFDPSQMCKKRDVVSDIVKKMCERNMSTASLNLL